MSLPLVLTRLGAALLLSNALCTSSTPKEPATTAPPEAEATAAPAAANADARASTLADKVMAQMGGKEGWQKTRLFGWDFLDGSYQLWDKQTGDFHWEKDDLVANYNLTTKQGKIYRAGQDISSTEEGQKLLDDMYATWVNNSWWLVMPFKLQDPGVTLTYQGPGKTMDGKSAEVLRMTFQKVGVTPENGYEVLVNPSTNLVEEWAYFPKATDAKPAFRRRWADYRRYGPLMLATDRTDGKDGRHLDHVSASETVPAGLMASTTPVQKL